MRPSHFTVVLGAALLAFLIVFIVAKGIVADDGVEAKKCAHEGKTWTCAHHWVGRVRLEGCDCR